MAGRIVCQVHRFPPFDNVHTESLWSILRIYRILLHIVREIKQIFYEKKKEKEKSSPAKIFHRDSSGERRLTFMMR